MTVNGTELAAWAGEGFGEHAGHLVHPHNHDGQPNEEPYRRHKWCSGRWLCQSCASEESPRGTWFDGPECVRPGAVGKDGKR